MRPPVLARHEWSEWGREAGGPPVAEGWCGSASDYPSKCGKAAGVRSRPKGARVWLGKEIQAGVQQKDLTTRRPGRVCSGMQLPRVAVKRRAPKASAMPKHGRATNGLRAPVVNRGALPM